MKTPAGTGLCRRAPFAAVLALALALALFAGCGTSDVDRMSLPPPLAWAKLGMERDAVLAHLPLADARLQRGELFVSLVDIKEPTFAEAGLTDLYLFFRRDGSRSVLNAVQLVYRRDADREAALRGELETRFGKAAARTWRVGKEFRVDMESAGAVCKITYDTEQR